MTLEQLFETEIKRHIKRPPALSENVERQGGVVDYFPQKSAGMDDVETGDIVSQLWSF